MNARVRRAAPYAVAALFAGSSVIHLTRPGVFLPLVPRWLPAREAIVLVSGLAELGCAVGLVAGRSWAGRASAALLLVVWVGNVQMALDSAHGGPVARWLTWARVPLQVPLIWAVLQAGRPLPEQVDGAA